MGAKQFTRCLLDFQFPIRGSNPLASLQPEEAKNKRGPKSPISDEELVSRYDFLVQVFSELWGEIGLALIRARDIGEMRRAFDVTLSWGGADHILRPFFTTEMIPASPKAIRSLRQRVKHSKEQRRKLYLSWTEADSKLKEARGALSNATPLAKGQLRIEFKKRKAEVCEVERLKSIADSECERLEEELLGMEAHFAAEQLHAFLRKPAGSHGKTRTAFDPHSLALALAGTGKIGWRESRDRLRKFQEKTFSHPGYQLFCAIRYLVEKANMAEWQQNFDMECRFQVTRAEALREFWVAHFRKNIPELRGTHIGVREELKKYFRFLRLSVEECIHEPKSYMPYLIHSSYHRRTHSQTSEEVVLAEAERL